MDSQRPTSLYAEESAAQDAQKRLVALMDRTGYPMVQDNGQRRYGPPPDWTGGPPPKGCEVFIGRLPRDVYEDELVPFLEQAGRLYEVRLMMDFAGSNRGYGFATYSCREEAKKAVRELDDREIRAGRRVGVCVSLDNCRLFVGGIPRERSRQEVLDEMQRLTRGVVDVILYPCLADRTRNRGFAFVEYTDHRAAAVARRQMVPGKMTLWGCHEVAVDWAEPEPVVDEETMQKVKVLYVRNVAPNTSEADLRTAFSAEDQLRVLRVKKIRDFAFVHYSKREDAVEGLALMNGATLGGSTLEVSWSKPAYPLKRGRRYTAAAHRAEGPDPNKLQGPPIVMPGPVAPFGYEFYPLAQPRISPAPPPIGDGRPADHYRPARNRGSGGSAASVFRHPANTRRPPAQQVMQALRDICHKQGWGEPAFFLYTVSGTESPASDGSDPLGQLYLFKVAIPSMAPPPYNVITPNRFCATIEEARLYAAECALREVLLRLETAVPVQYTPSLLSPVFVATPGATPSYGHGYPSYGAVLPGAGSSAMMQPAWRPSNIASPLV